MARIMTRRKAIPKAIELLQCLPQTEEVVEVIQALKKYSSTPLDRWDAASVYEALDEWTESHNGIPPKIKECDSHKELPSHMVFEKLFGKTAREFLNDYYGEMEYVRIGRHRTRCVDDQYDFLEIFKNEFERIQPATSKIYDACRNPETPSWGTIARRCKVSSWSELVTLSGVEANCIRRRYDTWGNIGNNYLKGLFALAFQGFFMMVCVGIYAVLVNAMTISSDLHGRKLALDQRLVNELLPDNPESKIAVCAEKSYEIWKDTAAQKSAQLIFCDLSTPKGDGSFNVYDDLKQKLIEKGVPEKEIAFIHDANTEAKKTELFGKVKSGQVRFLIGSTAKMGAGTNVQDRLIALHHLDIGWKPSDLEQREGRIIRQGNHNKKVHIFRYVTESTFDSYMWQLIENKQKFISQIMTSKAPVRSCEDVDEAALSYAEVKALATGNPAVKEKMALDVDVAKLKLLKANHMNNQYRLEDDIARNFPQQIAKLMEIIDSYKADIAHFSEHKITDPEQFSMEISGKVFTEKKEAGAALLAVCKDIKSVDAAMDIGSYQGFNMRIQFDSWSKEFILSVKHESVAKVRLGADALGNIIRINNLLESYPEKLAEAEQRLETVQEQMTNAKEEVGKPFPKEEELNQKLERLSELNALLNMDEREDTETEQSESKEKEERPARGSIHEKLQIYKEKSQRESETGKETRKWDFGLE